MSIDTMIGEAINSSAVAASIDGGRSFQSSNFMSSNLPIMPNHPSAVMLSAGGDPSEGDGAVNMYTCFTTTPTSASVNTENVAPMLSAAAAALFHENRQCSAYAADCFDLPLANSSTYGSYDPSKLSAIAASIAATTSMLTSNGLDDAKLMSSGDGTSMTLPSATTLSMSPTSKCGRCETSIDDRCFMLIGERSWHIGCVRCAVCAMPLDGLPTCFLRDGTLYCRRDYALKFTKRCERCMGAIGAGEIVMNATREKTFHLCCFSCVICGHELRAGETYFLAPTGGAIFCQMHSDILSPPPLLPPTTTAATIAKNGNNNASGSASEFLANRQLIIDGEQCNDVNRNIAALLHASASSKLLAEVGFGSCSKTSNNSGDWPANDAPTASSMTTLADGINKTNDVNAKSDTAIESSGDDKHGTPNNFLKFDTITAIATNIATTTSSSSSTCSASSSASSSSTTMAPTGGSSCFVPHSECSLDDEFSLSGSKAKRMRTSFKHHQLRTMKAYFNLNHNPDAKDLKQLAQKTGLTKRVLQVWFQNARAKFRRSQQTHRDAMMPRCGGATNGSGDGSPSGVAYAMELHMLSNSMDFNGINCGTTSSLSGRTSLSPEESSMYDVCSSFADDSVSSVGGADNSDNDCAAAGQQSNTVHGLLPAGGMHNVSGGGNIVLSPTSMGGAATNDIAQSSPALL